MSKIDTMFTDIASDEVTNLTELIEIQTRYSPSNAYLPHAHDTYNIDLNTRTIHGPEVLSVQNDHKAKVIYFKVDRYYDYMDLSNTVCLIEYIVSGDTNRIPYIYIVPYFDTYTYIQDNKIIFPWVVSGIATMNEGDIEYSIRFYKATAHDDADRKLLYNLNTRPAKSKILHSIVDENVIQEEYAKIEQLQPYEDLVAQIQEQRTYWTILS